MGSRGGRVVRVTGSFSRSHKWVEFVSSRTCSKGFSLVFLLHSMDVPRLIFILHCAYVNYVSSDSDP